MNIRRALVYTAIQVLALVAGAAPWFHLALIPIWWALFPWSSYDTNSEDLTGPT